MMFPKLSTALLSFLMRRHAKVGTIKSAQPHRRCDSKAAFVRGIARGFGANMEQAARMNFCMISRG